MYAHSIERSDRLFLNISAYILLLFAFLYSTHSYEKGETPKQSFESGRFEVVLEKDSGKIDVYSKDALAEPLPETLVVKVKKAGKLLDRVSVSFLDLSDSGQAHYGGPFTMAKQSYIGLSFEVDLGPKE